MTDFKNDIEAYLVVCEGYTEEYAKEILECKHEFVSVDSWVCCLHPRQEVWKTPQRICKFCKVPMIMHEYG